MSGFLAGIGRRVLVAAAVGAAVVIAALVAPVWFAVAFLLIVAMGTALLVSGHRSRRTFTAQREEKPR